MIRFSDRQLKTPKFQRDVYLVTGGNSEFRRSFPDKKTEELAIDAFKEACDYIGKSPVELKKIHPHCLLRTLCRSFWRPTFGRSSDP